MRDQFWKCVASQRTAPQTRNEAAPIYCETRRQRGFGTQTTVPQTSDVPLQLTRHAAHHEHEHREDDPKWQSVKLPLHHLLLRERHQARRPHEHGMSERPLQSTHHGGLVLVAVAWRAEQNWRSSRRKYWASTITKTVASINFSFSAPRPSPDRLSASRLSGSQRSTS